MRVGLFFRSLLSSQLFVLNLADAYETNCEITCTQITSGSRTNCNWSEKRECCPSESVGAALSDVNVLSSNGFLNITIHFTGSLPRLLELKSGEDKYCRIVYPNINSKRGNITIINLPGAGKVIVRPVTHNCTGAALSPEAVCWNCFDDLDGLIQSYGNDWMHCKEYLKQNKTTFLLCKENDYSCFSIEHDVKRCASLPNGYYGYYTFKDCVPTNISSGNYSLRMECGPCFYQTKAVGFTGSENIQVKPSVYDFPSLIFYLTVSTLAVLMVGLFTYQYVKLQKCRTEETIPREFQLDRDLVPMLVLQPTILLLYSHDHGIFDGAIRALKTLFTAMDMKTGTHTLLGF